MMQLLTRLAAILAMVLLFGSVAPAAEVMKTGEWIGVASATDVKGAKLSGDKQIVGYITDGAAVTFGPLEFSDGLVDRVELQLAAPNDKGKISIHLDSPDGNKIAEISIRSTGDYDTFSAQVADCEQLAGTHSVVLVVRGGDDLCNIKAFRFLKPGQPAMPAPAAADPKQASTDAKAKIEAILAENQPAIEKHRTTLITLRTAPGATVRVKQTRHHFQFGTAINNRAFVPGDSMIDADREIYKRTVLENFNSVVHENEMKWYANEGAKDKITYAHADAMLDWSEKNGLYTRGHCVYWGRDELVQKWQKDLDDNALRAKLEQRAKDYLAHFKGRVSEYDMNNEMLHCHYYSKRLGADIHRQMFEWCRQYGPDATFYVNDYSILSGGQTDNYIKQIDGFLKAGVKLGGIGVQGHFGKSVDAQQVRIKLDKLAKFGLPIKVTEFDANTKDENAKALALTTLYSTAFAHPAIEGLYMWGFWKKAHWRPDAAMYNADWSPTLAADYYREMVFKRWWTDATVTADDKGVCKVRVFYGKHDITLGSTTRSINVAPGATAEFDLRPRP